MKRKNIFNSLIFWKLLISLVCIGAIIGCSSMLVFYFKVFEKWDKAKVVYVGEMVAVGDNMYGADIKYIVDGLEYEKFISPGSGIGYQWFPNNNQEMEKCYIDYLVSNPNYTFTDRLTGVIPFSIVEVIIVTAGVLFLVKTFKRKREG